MFECQRKDPFDPFPGSHWKPVYLDDREMRHFITRDVVKFPLVISAVIFASLVAERKVYTVGGGCLVARRLMNPDLIKFVPLPCEAFDS